MALELRAAKADDSERLKIFYSRETLGTDFELRLGRKDTFFETYRLQTSDFDTYVLQDTQGQIEACGTILFREGRLGGHFQTIGYATDLRVSHQREAIRTWANHFTPCLDQSTRRRGCHYVFSVVPGDRHGAFNTLIRPRSSRRQLPRFYLFRQFEVIAIHGQMPWASRVPSIDVREATTNDIEAIANYLNHRSQQRPLSFRYSAELLSFRLRSWPGLKIENFLIAKDAAGDIIGCVAPWMPHALMNIEVIKYGGFISTFKGMLRACSLLGWTRPLPAVGEELRVRHLTHLNADNPDIFEALLLESMDRHPTDHFQCYAHFEGNPLTTPPQHMITSAFPFALYTVLRPGESLPDELKPGLRADPPELELCLI
jgi:hypothetical protein